MIRVPAARNRTEDDGVRRAAGAESHADQANYVPGVFTHSPASEGAAPRLRHFPLSPTFAVARLPA